MSPSIRANRMDRLARRKSSFRLFCHCSHAIRSWISAAVLALAQGIRTERRSRLSWRGRRLCCAHLLKIPADRFRPIDLRNVSDLGRGFDLCLLAGSGGALAGGPGKNPSSAALVKAAPVVLFSAAIPLQGGTEHVNEQWQSYWAKLFAEHGTSLWIASARQSLGIAGSNGGTVKTFWYFCLPVKCPPGCTPVAGPYDLNRVDPVMIDRLATNSYVAEARKHSCEYPRY